MTKSPAFLLLALLAACGGSPRTEPAQSGSEAWFATSSPKAQAEYFAAACRAFGLKSGTDEFTRCIREEIDRRHALNRSAREQEREDRVADLTKNRTTETRCTRFGDTLSCESY